MSICVKVNVLDKCIAAIITITYTAAAGNGTIIMAPTLTANGDGALACTGGKLDDS